jgi:hypothetical protein
MKKTDSTLLVREAISNRCAKEISEHFALSDMKWRGTHSGCPVYGLFTDPNPSPLPLSPPPLTYQNRPRVRGQA